MGTAVAAVLLTGCAHVAVAPSSDTFIRIERSVALGAPLDFELTLYDDGLVTYASLAGQKSAQVGKEEVARLIAAFEKLGDPLTWGCDPERPVHESPGATVTVSRRGVKESVKHPAEDICVAEGLWGLEAEIEAVGRGAL